MESTWLHTYRTLEANTHVLMVARLNPSVHFRVLARINDEWTYTTTFYVHDKLKDLGSRASLNFIIKFKILR
jgi:S-adenosylmethionine:diacylglycerol 3-amino-3-carboxypropyl transferase